MEDRIKFPQKLRLRLDQLGEDRPRGEGQKARFPVWSNEVFEALYDTLIIKRNFDLDLDDGERDARSDAILKFIEGIGAYDPDREALSHYAQRAVNQNYKVASNTEVTVQSTGGLSAEKLRRIGAKRKKLERSLQNADPATRQKLMDEFDAIHYPKVDSLRLEQEGDDEAAHTNDPGHLDDTISALISQNQMLEMARQIILLRQNYSGERKNSTRMRLFPLWFTEKITNAVQSNLLPNDENNTFYAMELSYLDFFLEGECRSFFSMQGSKLRKEKELFPECSSLDRLRWSNDHWLEAKVPIRYLLPQESYTDTRISRSRKSYEDELQRILDCHLTSGSK